MMKEKDVLPFLKDYIKSLLDFELPESDFPLHYRTSMPRGCVIIETSDCRHIATVIVKGDATSCSMPLGPATLAYAQLFVELANGLANK
jgi:hypothetical protein